jgi:hypothetical protein
MNSFPPTTCRASPSLASATANHATGKNFDTREFGELRSRNSALSFLLTGYRQDKFFLRSFQQIYDDDYCHRSSLERQWK